MNKALVNLHKSVLYAAILFSFLLTVPVSLDAQEIVDETVATVSDGGEPELITYSDLLWQLALVPNAPLNPPTSEDLNLALQVIIRQRLIALEAKRVPREEPSEDEVDEEIKRVLDQFPSTADFVRRLNIVGFDSVKDENFQEMMEQRVSIEKYVDFRFRSFVVITPEDEKDYYRNVFTPEFRRQNPGLLLPSLEEVRDQINQTLTERKVESDIENFLDNARDRAEINVLSEI
ncbi:MAG: hypothetical protein HKN25_00235 [Pyrinomonadaceae bacterium]|nr:hypothetical protein [Pyrinomonadaceae bacterium]